MIQHFSEDLVVEVSADVRLSELQRELAAQRQWLPLDPPGDPTIGEIIDGNLSGPRRFGYGAVRDHLLGIRVRLRDGREIQSGGRVVKNVAGYDLGKLFVGAQGRLGRVLTATFKLWPRPETEQFVSVASPDWFVLERFLETVWQAPLRPVVLDIVSPRRLIVGVAGGDSEVRWQIEQLAALGITEPATLDYNRRLPRHASVAPSRVVATLADLGADAFVARAGNGWIEYRGGKEMPPPSAAPVWLQARLEETL